MKQLLAIQLSMDLGTRSCSVGKVPPAACEASREAEALFFLEGTAARHPANLGSAF